MTSIENLPLELQNKVCSYVGVHACAKMIKRKMTDSEEPFDEDHYIFLHDCILYKNPYRRHIWRAGNCMLCKKNGRKLYYEKYVYKSNVCKRCFNFSPGTYYEYSSTEDENSDEDSYEDSDEDSDEDDD